MSCRIRAHPLAITSVCDHFTRVQKKGSKLNPGSKVIGLIFGIQDADTVEIMDCTEAIYTIVDNIPQLNVAEIEKKRKLWIAVYPRHDLLGWYSVDNEVAEWHMRLHVQFSTLCSFPIFMLVNLTSNALTGNKRLPLSFFRLEETAVENKKSVVFVDMKYDLSSSDCERVAIDAIAKATPLSDRDSALAQHSLSLASSLRVMSDRVSDILHGLESAELRLTEPNISFKERYTLMEYIRQVGRLKHYLQAQHAPTEKQSESKVKESDEALLVSSLAQVTMIKAELAELSSLYSTAYIKREEDATPKPMTNKPGRHHHMMSQGMNMNIARQLSSYGMMG